MEGVLKHLTHCQVLALHLQFYFCTECSLVRSNCFHILKFENSTFAMRSRMFFFNRNSVKTTLAISSTFVYSYIGNEGETTLQNHAEDVVGFLGNLA